MKNNYESKILLEAIELMDRSSAITLIEDAIKAEKINLEINMHLNNFSECMRIKNRIADGKLLIVALRGNLFS